MSITFVTKDGERIQTDARIKTMSKMLETLEVEQSQDTPIDVSASIFRQIEEFCLAHNYESPAPAEKPLKSKVWEEIVPSEWARVFLKNKDVTELVEFVDAVNYLDIESLFSYCCARIAFEFAQNSLAEIQLKYDFSGELSIDEELQLFKENPWLHEGDKED